MTLGGKTFTHYKAKQLKKVGCVMTGRGMLPLFDTIEESINKSGARSFDTLLPMLEDIARSGTEQFLHKALKADTFPGGLTLDETNEFLISMGAPFFAMSHINLCIIGYSKKKGSMGVAFVQSDKKYRVETSYKNGLFFFLKKPPIQNYTLQLGRPPRTDAEFLNCMKLVFNADQKGAKENGFNLTIGGGFVQKTEVTRAGKFKVDQIGSLEETGPRSSQKKEKENA